ncbi:MAG: sodium/proline symporter PutP [Balneolales bacterium]
MNSAILSTFIIYLLALITFGMAFYRYNETLSDYILGGRKLKSGVTALSAGASDMSGWLLLGLPGAVYAAGLNQIWIVIGLATGAWLNWQFVAARLRIYSQQTNDAITLPDYLESRFEDKSRILRIVSATVILFFFTVYTASGLVAGAKLFESTFNWPYEGALLSGAGVVVIYTFLGGFMAVSWTDFFQGILMFIALITAPVMLIFFYENWSSLLSGVAAVDPSMLDVYSAMTVTGVISLLGWGLGYFGQPHILARFMAIESPKLVPKAQVIGIGWMVFSLMGAVLVGFTGIAYFADAPLADAEYVFLTMIQELFNPWIAGILLAAILSAVMSTVDSQLLVCSSAIAEDFYKGLLRPSAGYAELVLVGRSSVIAVALIALVLAWNPERMVLELVAYAWAGFGASFGPVILFSLFWRRMTREGALAGMITGAMVVVLWNRLGSGLFDLYEIVPGFLISSIAILIFSVTAGSPSESVLKKFDSIGTNG